MSETSVAKQQLEDMNRRLLEEHHKDATWDGAVALVKSAIISSNGAPDKIAAMAETQALMVHYLVQREERASKPLTVDDIEVILKMAKAAHDGACLLSDMVILGPLGERKLDVAKLAAAVTAVSPVTEDSLAINLPKFPKFMELKGRASVQAGMKFLKYASIVLFILYVVRYNNGELKKQLSSQRIHDIVEVLRVSGLPTPENPVADGETPTSEKKPEN